MNNSNRIAENGTCTQSGIISFLGHNKNKYSYSNHVLNNVEGDKMDNDKILEKYLEKVDRDQSDLRNDIRESERRTQERISAIEQKMDDRLNRIEDMMISQNKKMESLKDALLEKMDSTQKWITGIAITTIIGIAAMVIAVLVA